MYRAPWHCHPPPCRTALSDPLFECTYGTGQQNGLYGCRASAMNLLPQRANAGSEPNLIRFAEPTAVDTVLNKRSLLLLASNRCKPLRSASVRLQGPPRSGCTVLAREPIMCLCLSPSACPNQTSAARGHTTRATVTLFVRGAAAWGKLAGTPCTTGLPLWPLSILLSKPIRPKWSCLEQPR